MRILLLSLTLLLAAPVQARMYQWVNPQTDTTQLSGTPPSWYRSGDPGPRVFVFENGKIVDDTAIKVTPAERERLREQAFSKADETTAAAQRAAPAAAPGPSAGSGAAGTSYNESVYGQEAEAAAEPPAPDTANDKSRKAQNTASTQSTIERLKAIIADWDKQQTEHAKGVIDTENQLKQLLKNSPPPSGSGP